MAVRLRDLVEGDTRLTTGGRGAPSTLGRDQVPDAVLTGADDPRGHPQRGGHYPTVDHHQPEVAAGDPLLDEHLRVLLARACHRGGELVGALVGENTHGDAFALLTAGWFDHDLADFLQEGIVVIVAGRQAGTRHDDACLGDQAPGQAFVVAPAHGDRGGELGQRLTGEDAAATVGQSHLTGSGIQHLDPDSAAHRLVGDDPRVRIEVVDRLRGRGEQRLVDRVLAFDRQHRNAAKAQLFVEADSRGVVVRDGKVKIGAARTAEVLGQCPGQRFPDSGKGSGGVDRQRPQAGSVLRVVEEH